MAEEVSERLVEHFTKMIATIVDQGKALPADKAKEALTNGFVRSHVKRYLLENSALLEDISAGLPKASGMSSDLLDGGRPGLNPRQLADLLADVIDLGVSNGIEGNPKADAATDVSLVREILSKIPSLSEFRRGPETDRARQFIESETVGGVRKAGPEKPSEYSERDRARIALFHRFLSDGSSCGNHMYGGKAYQVLVDRVVCVRELPASLTSTTEDDLYWRCISEAKYEGGISQLTSVVSDVYTFDSREFSILLPDETQVPRKPNIKSYAGADPTEIERSQARLASGSPNGSEIWLPLVTPPFDQFPMGSRLISVDIKLRLYRGKKSTLTEFLDSLADTLGIVVSVGTVIAGLVTANPLIPAAGAITVGAVRALSSFLQLIAGEMKIVSIDVSYSASALKDAFDAQIIQPSAGTTGGGYGGFPGTYFPLPLVSDGEGVTDLNGPRNVHGTKVYQRFIGSSVRGRQTIGNTNPPKVTNVDSDDIGYWYEVFLRFERKPAPVLYSSVAYSQN